MSQPQPAKLDLVERLTDEIMEELQDDLGYLNDYTKDRIRSVITAKLYHIDDVAYNEGVCDGHIGYL